MTLPEEMIQYRARHNVSQGKAAELVGINRQTWCNIETGRQDPSRLTEAKIKMIIGKEVNDEGINIADKAVQGMPASMGIPIPRKADPGA